MADLQLFARLQRPSQRYSRSNVALMRFKTASEGSLNMRMNQEKLRVEAESRMVAASLVANRYDRMLQTCLR